MENQLILFEVISITILSDMQNKIINLHKINLFINQEILIIISCNSRSYY